MTKADWDWHAPKSVKRFFDFYLEDGSTPENGSETRNGRTRNVAMIKMFQNVRGPVSSQRIVYACGKGDILGDGWFPREMTPVWETSAEIPYWWRVTTQIWLVLLIGWGNCTSGHSTTRSGWWHFISVEFLRLILRRHFAREPVLGVPKCQLFCSGYMKTNVEILRSYWHHNLWIFFFFCTAPYEVDYGYELWDFRAL